MENAIKTSTKIKWGLFIFLLIFLVSCDKNNLENSTITTFANEDNLPKIRFIGQWYNEGKRRDLLVDFTREYEFKNQHVLVDLKFPEQLFTDHADRLSNARIVSKLIYDPNPQFDIIRLNNQYSQISSMIGDPNWTQKYLIDFSQIPEFRQHTLPNLLTEEMKATWGGIIPGPFLEGAYWALWTNKTLEAKLGIHVKTRGMTFDDFLEYIQIVDNHNKTHPNDYIVPLYEANDWQTEFAVFFHLFASALNNTNELFDKKVTENKLQAWQRTLKAIELLAKYHPLSQSQTQTIWEQTTGDLIEEKCLFYVNGSWMYNIWQSKDAGKIRKVIPCELPVFNPINLYPSAYFITWGVLKNSPNRDEAVKLLLAMNSPDMAEMWVQYTKCPTGIKGRFTDLSFGGDQFEVFSNHIQNYYGGNTYNWEEQICELVNGSKESQKLFYREVFRGEMTADEAMKLVRINIKKP